MIYATLEVKVETESEDTFKAIIADIKGPGVTSIETKYSEVVK